MSDENKQTDPSWERDMTAPSTEPRPKLSDFKPTPEAKKQTITELQASATKRMRDHEVRQAAAVNVVQLVRMQMSRNGEFTNPEANAIFDIANMLHTLAGEG